MKILHTFVSIVLLVCIPPAFAYEAGNTAGHEQDKELKRTAHRMRISVERLQDARDALMEATGLVMVIDPFPVEQLSGLASSWSQLYRSRAESTIESLLVDLGYRCNESIDIPSYQKALSTAAILFNMLADFNSDKPQVIVDAWPYPPEYLGEAALDARRKMIGKVKRNALMRLLREDPAKAKELLYSLEGEDSLDYGTAASVAQNLANSGMLGEAQEIIDDTLNDFKNQSVSDPEIYGKYQSFIQRVIRYMDADQTRAAIDDFAGMAGQTPPGGGDSVTLERGNIEVELTGTEYRFLSLLRSLQQRPELLVDTLNSRPELKAKLDDIGGIDSYFGAGRYGSERVNIRHNKPSNPAAKAVPATVLNLQSSSEILKKIKGKASKDPSLVRRKLSEIAKGPEGIDLLVRLAMSSTYQDPDLAEMALEKARTLLQQTDSIEKKSSILQNLIRAYRQLDGEVDEDLLRRGFIIADRMRVLHLDANPPGGNPGTGSFAAMADQLEIFLISELARDSYDKAIQYVRSLDNGKYKLECMLRIAQVLVQQY